MFNWSKRRILGPLGLLLWLAVIIVSGQQAVRAQANPGASRKADISVFGGYSFGNPDYGPKRNTGGTIGANYTRFYGWFVSPSLEVRANRTSGYLLNEETISAGIRGRSDFSRFHPYGDVLFGGVRLSYHYPYFPPNLHDTSSVLSVGGGVDVDVVRHIQAKFDFQREYMNFGGNGTLPNNADFTLTPNVFTIGAAYHTGGSKDRR